MGLPVKAEADQLPELIGIDPAHHGRHQDNAQPGRGQIVDGPPFFGQQPPAAQGGKDLVAHPVKLEKDRGEPRVAQSSGQCRVAGKGEAVAVQLDEGEAGVSCRADDLREIGAHGRFAAGELEVAAAGLGDDGGEHPRERRRIGICRGAAAVGKTDGTTQIAAGGDFDEGGAGPLAMGFAEAAVKRAAPARRSAVAAGIGQFGPEPGKKGRFAPPDRGRKRAVVRAALFQPDSSRRRRSVVRSTRRRHSGQTLSTWPRTSVMAGTRRIEAVFHEDGHGPAKALGDQTAADGGVRLAVLDDIGAVDAAEPGCAVFLEPWASSESISGSLSCASSSARPLPA